MEHIEIKIGKGVGAIQFGMLREDVVKLLGQPSEKELEKEFDTGDAVETWEYDEHGLSLSFDEEEGWKLETITLNSSKFKLNGVGLIGQDIQQVQDFIEQQELGEMEFEDYSSPEFPKHELIDVDEANMFFWFDQEILKEIQFGVQWDDDDNALWPQ